MATPVRLDAGVTNLQLFIAQLVNSVGALEKSSEHFKDSAHRFGEMEDEAADHGGGLNGALEELRSALEAGLKGAVDALAELGQAATGLSDQSQQFQQQLNEATSSLEQQAETTVSGLADASGRLTSEGFEALGRTLDEAEKELQTESQETGQGFEHFEGAVDGERTDADAAWDAAEAALDEAVTEVGQGAAVFEAAVGHCVEGFDSEAGEFEQHCTQLASEVDAIYDLLDGAVDQEGNQWEQNVDALGKRETAWAEASGQERLEHPAQIVEDEALSALEQEYAALGTVIEGGRNTAAEVEPLAGDLARCQSVVGEVDELMKALAG